MSSAVAELATKGFALAPAVLDPEEIAQWIDDLGPVTGAGRRGLLSISAVAALARSEKILKLLRPHFPAKPRAVRGIYFDKLPHTNWLVAWHQDLSIAVNSVSEIPGFGPWSVKEGVPHVQPPADLLDQMLTIRLHLDNTDESNGALRVLPGSHQHGRLSAGQIHALRQTETEHVCRARAGDALLLRPLLLHASGRSSTERHRRVIHLEYAGFDLPEGLRWHENAGGQTNNLQ